MGLVVLLILFTMAAIHLLCQLHSHCYPTFTIHTKHTNNYIRAKDNKPSK